VAVALMRPVSYVGCGVAALIGILVVTSPSGVSPAHTPTGSTTSLLPPWPIFRVAIALNEFFEAAAVATRPPPVQVKALATAYWQSEVSYSLTKSGIIDALGAESATCAATAKKLGLVEDFACRMMSAGASLKLLSATPTGVYTLSDAGDLLRTDHPGSLRSFMLMINEESKESWRAAGTKSLETGTSGFKQHFGSEFWDWHSGIGHGRQMAQFDSAMKSFSAEISGSLLVDWKPPTSEAVVCDVGGGVGHMLIAIASHWPETSGVVFDLPAVAKRAAEALEGAGLTDRVRTIGGSFLKPLPKELSQCDVFYLKFILHDWDDAVCHTILANIVAIAKPGAKVVTTDFILEVDGANMEMSKRLMDINMMASNPAGARERTWPHYRGLFEKAGLKGTSLIKMRDLVSTVEATV